MKTEQPLILVLDDVRAIVDELITLFELNGLPAVGASTLGEAVIELERGPGIRVVACDIRLGSESGLDIIARVDDSAGLSGRLLHYVFITGDPLSRDELSPHFQHFLLTKPVQPRTLIEMVKDLLAKTEVNEYLEH